MALLEILKDIITISADLGSFCGIPHIETKGNTVIISVPPAEKGKQCSNCFLYNSIGSLKLGYCKAGYHKKEKKWPIVPGPGCPRYYE